MNKKICFILISNGISGAELMVYHSIKKLCLDFEIYLIINDEISEFFLSIIPKCRVLNIGRIYSFRQKWIRKLIENRFYSLINLIIFLRIFKVNAFIREKSISVLHCHLEGSLILGFFVKSNKIRLLYTVHDVICFFDKSWRGTLKRICVKFCLSKCDELIFVGNYVNNIYRSRVPKIPPSHIICNGIYVPSNFRRPPNTSYNSTHRLLFVGGDKLIKGADILLEALVILINKNPNLKFNISWLGQIDSNWVPERIDFLRLNEYVTLVGYVKPPDHLIYYQNSDVLIFPSRSEAFPVALLEAIQVGLPVIATKVGGIPEIIQADINGLLFCPNAESLAISIERILTDFSFYDRIQTNILKNREEFSLDAMAFHLAKIY